MRQRNAQTGFSLVTAVFLLLVVSLVAGYAVSIGGAQQMDTALELSGKRADFAARSGLEWAIAQTLESGACPAAGTHFSAAGTGIERYGIAVACSATTVTEGASTYAMYAITVTATFGSEGSDDFVRRTVTAQVSAI